MLAPSVWHQQLPSILTQYTKPSIYSYIGSFIVCQDRKLRLKPISQLIGGPLIFRPLTPPLSCFDTFILVRNKLPLTPHHILVISNLILAKNVKSNAGINIWFCVLCRNVGQFQTDGANGILSQGLNIGCQMDHLDLKWLGFVIYLVLRMHPFQKYHLLITI